MDEPKDVNPKTANAEPNRTSDRRARELPLLTIANTAIVAPRRDIARKDMADPK